MKKQKANQQATEEQPAEDVQAVKPRKKKANQQAVEEQPAEDGQAVKPRKKKSCRKDVEEACRCRQVARARRSPSGKTTACDPAIQDCPS